MIEVRWHARAGQGAKTASQLLAMAELRDGRYVQAFPEYGPERGGAPVRAYTRIDERPVRRRFPVAAPDVVVVIEPSLLREVDVTDGLERDGLLILNLPEGTSGPPCDAPVRVLDAAAIAKPRYVNAMMLGALAGALGRPSLDAVLRSSRELFGRKLAPRVLDEVEEAIRAGRSATLEKEVTA